jgi:hypothetical protein
VTEELVQIQQAFRKRRTDDPKGLVHQYAVAAGLGTNVSKQGLLTGDVALAMVVRVDPVMSSPGRSEGVGLVVHSRDRLVWAVPEVLSHCANRLLRSEEDARKTGDWLLHPWSRLNQMSVTLGDRRPINMDVSALFADGFNLQLSRMLFHRALLPHGRMATDRFPVIAPTPGGPLFVPFVVHQAYWPQSWKDKGGA